MPNIGAQWPKLMGPDLKPFRLAEFLRMLGAHFDQDSCELWVDGVRLTPQQVNTICEGLARGIDASS